MIVRISKNSKLKDSICQFYIGLYKQFKAQNPNDKTYTREKLFQNIREILSIDGKNINQKLLRNSIYYSWDNNGWKEFQYKTWYFAITIHKMPNGSTIGIIQDGHHNSNHHNDKMETQPYDESIINIISIIENYENT